MRPVKNDSLQVICVCPTSNHARGIYGPRCGQRCTIGLQQMSANTGAVMNAVREQPEQGSLRACEAERQGGVGVEGEAEQGAAAVWLTLPTFRGLLIHLKSSCKAHQRPTTDVRSATQRQTDRQTDSLMRVRGRVA